MARVETFFRKDENTWLMHTVEGLKERVVLQSLGCEIEMEQLYKKVFEIP